MVSPGVSAAAAKSNLAGTEPRRNDSSQRCPSGAYLWFMSDLVPRFRDELLRCKAFPAGGVAIVAVSGGPDSVALLDLLHAVATDLGLSLVVAHADHGIPPESAAVSRAVRALAERYDLPFELGELRLGRETSETTARRARYQWLRGVQDRRGARYLVTAHHRDDQIETVLLRVLRGSAPAGLAGIRARGPRGLVRPLLSFTKDELAGYAAERGLPSHDDPANREVRHLRSWVRTELLPAIVRRLGPRALRDIARVGRSAARERRAWDQALELVPELEVQREPAGFSVARGVFARYDDALGVSLLRAAARRSGLVLGPRRAQKIVTLARGDSGRRVELGQRWIARAALDRLVVTRAGDAPRPAPVVAATSEGRAVFGDFAVQWRPDAAPERVAREGWTTWVAGPGWEVRAPAAGDVLRPLGGVGRRPVRRLLLEARIPRDARALYPVVARGHTILWVPGVCRSADELPSPGTRAVRVDVSGTADA
jgi:tRNA(Ile)-lysidine synthase